MEGVALRLRHDVLGQLVAEHLATAAIILGRRRDESWAEAWPSQSCAPDTRLSLGGVPPRRAGRGHVIRGSSHENAEWVSGRVGEHIQGLILVVGAVEQFSGTES